MIQARLAQELAITPEQVKATVALLDEGNTVPFIARYRKEITGGLDDTQLRQLEERLGYMRELEERKKTILAAIEEQGKLTDELAALIKECDTKARLEDLYLPFKKRRKTKADAAREAGLEPLLEQLLANEGEPDNLAANYLNESVSDTKSALEGARAILIDRFATNADLVGALREHMYTHGSMRAEPSRDVNTSDPGEAAKFKDYFEFSEPFRTLPSHRILALLRGEKEGALALTLDAGPDDIYEQMIRDTLDSEATPWVNDAIHWGWKTKLYVSSALDVRMRLKETAEQGALEVFATNLKDVLLAAPAGQRATMGLDPGYRNGVKVAVVDSTGKVVATTIVYPHQPQNRWKQAVDELTALANAHKVELIAIGNGTASRESEKLAREVSKAAHDNPTCVVVSESGASVYSASELAAAEFPSMDVSLRGAVSIARRLQDPLAELVKIDPKSIGVGQYQHDVNQTQLARTLDAVVEDAVNAVGVDVNTASVPLLTRVAGVTPTLASNIVAYRDEHGAFATRKELGKVPRLGPKAFEQCAGFLRVSGEEPLDASAVHPESYPVVRQMCSASGLGVRELIGNTRVLNALKPSDFVSETVGEPTVVDIIRELDKPGRDPRPEFKTASFSEGIEKISDLAPGMVLEGTVTNVAAFGAFVDIGVHQDGLVHISAMANHYVSDPREVVRSGDIVRVKVVDVDESRKRIGLSMRLDDDVASGARSKPSHGGDAGSSAGGGSRQKQRSGARRQKSSAERGGALADALRRAGLG